MAADLALFASGESTFNAPYVPPQAEVSGRWCSPSGDVFTLEPVAAFTVSHLSRRFTEDLLPAEGAILANAAGTSFRPGRSGT